MSSAAPVARRVAHLIGDDHLARLLVQRGRLAPEVVERAFRTAQERGAFLEEVLVSQGLVDAGELRRELESHFFCPSTALEHGPSDLEVARLLPRSLALRRLALPVGREGDAFVVAIGTPDDRRTIAELEKALGAPVLPVVALRHELQRAIGIALPGTTREPTAEAEAPAAEPNAPLLDGRRVAARSEPTAVVDEILEAAARRGATDVHFEPQETSLQVRFRVDGVLQRAAVLPAPLRAPMASRLKVLGGMDIAERRAPQDGRATLKMEDRAVDVRLSALPSQWGETIVARLLAKDARLLSLEGLAMPPDVASRHREMVESPMGLFVVTGPTGSGKTTTLYATLNAIDRDALGVVTLEDPIEYDLEGVVQVQVNPPAGLTFASGLKSILRQDPDVILVGEIRDATTAEIACQAALTGHAVLSTLHANDATQAVTRLVDMGVASHLVAATLRGALAQRLLRACCPDCRQMRDLSTEERRLLGDDAPQRCARPVGCDACGGTGHRGRQGVFEYFRLDEDLQALVLAQSSAAALRAAARQRGMRTLLDAGRDALRDGRTTFEEVRRVLLADDGAGRPCPGCTRSVREEFDVCPHCRHVLRHRCAHCEATVDPDWIACPSCSRPLEKVEARASCSRCEAPLGERWKSCPFCGERAA